jgi:hypothetical protein
MVTSPDLQPRSGQRGSPSAATLSASASAEPTMTSAAVSLPGSRRRLHAPVPGPRGGAPGSRGRRLSRRTTSAARPKTGARTACSACPAMTISGRDRRSCPGARQASRSTPTRLPLGTTQGSVGGAGSDYCNRCGERASRDGLRPPLPIVRGTSQIRGVAGYRSHRERGGQARLPVGGPERYFAIGFARRPRSRGRISQRAC